MLIALQVGPVNALIHNNHLRAARYRQEGQYIAAGYSGHGMPRAYAWYVASCPYPNLCSPMDSAEAVAGMIKAKIRGERWSMPEWLPESYLTTAKH